jgi:3-deoxy-manno-octulosonate cytidylyltransferase (CMP-KDO synthetase)
VARKRAHVDVFVNVQGDEPEISGDAIDHVIQLLRSNATAQVATLATPIRRRKDLDDPACVKVVRNHAGTALYFSRSAIPHPRTWDDSYLSGDVPMFLQHLGIYAYRREFLLSLESMPQSPAEQLEKLEQLRFLQAGCQIVVGITPHAQRGIDTREDYDAFLARWRESEATKTTY